MSFCDVMWCLELIFKSKYFVSWAFLVRGFKCNFLFYFGNYKMVSSTLESIV